MSNIPYHISTAIVEKLFPLSEKIETVTLLVQKEYAEKLISMKSYISYFVNYLSDIELCFVVDKTKFNPTPKVDSAVIHATLYKNKSLNVLKIIKNGFF